MNDETPAGEKQSQEGPIEPERDIVYYYSRERRLSRASPEVRALNDGKVMRPSLSRTLLATKSHRLLFFTIVFFFAVTGLVSRFTGRFSDTGFKLGNNTVALTILQEEGVLILGIVKEIPKNGEFYLGSVDLAVSPVLPKPKEGEESDPSQVFVHRIFFNPIENEIYQITLPFDGTDFIVVLKAGEEQKSVRLKARN